MAKITLTDLSTLEDQTTALGVLNDNWALIETAMEKTLSRDGTSPNVMSAELDMNSLKIINLGLPTAAGDATSKFYVDSVASQGIPGTNGTNGTNGLDGDDGWAPVFAVVSDGARRVLQLVSYTGGTGTAPTAFINFYLSLTGPVASIASATDIRGAQGTSGAGTGDLLAANNLSDVASIATARTNLGLAIGTNVQAFDAELASIAGLTSAADRLPYFTGLGTATLATFTAFGRSLVDDAASSNARTTLGLVIGTDVQAFDATLLSIATLGTAADRIAYTTGVNTWVETPLTAFGRSLIDDAAASNARTTLGLGTAAVANTGTSAGNVVVLDGSAKLPAVDGSQLTNVAAGGLVLLASGTVSAASTLDIDISSFTTYRGFIFEIINFIPATDAVDFYLRTSTDGGATFDSSTGHYEWAVNEVDVTNQTGAAGTTTRINLNQTGDPIGNLATEGITATVKLMDAFVTTNFARFRFECNYSDETGEPRYIFGGGARSTAGDVTDVRFLFSTGNIASGKYAVYGLA